MNKTILITGATSGIGKACASRFAALQYKLIITGRREELLRNLALELSREYGSEVLPLVFDVRNKKEVKGALGTLPDEWRKIDVLVNNAGLASGLDFIHEADEEDWDRMIDTNVKGLLHVTRMIAPLMIANGSGHIINIGSIAGKEVYPRGNVYCATKFAVDAITQGTRIDLLSHGIKVTQICPGAAETEFSEVRYKGDRVRAADVYKGFHPLTAADVAEAISWVAGLPPHVNVNDLVIMPVAQASPAYFHKVI